MNRILAIDDNQDNLVTVTALLKLFIQDCEIITATSGEQGIIIAKKEQPDTILLDIHMPGMDGFDTCRQLKKTAETSHIPIIMITAVRTDSKSRVKALELGADAFLSKPVDESELAAQIKAMLRIKKAEDKLRNEKEHLEQLVTQRVHELSIANEQLLREMEERALTQSELEMKSNAIENSLNGFYIINQDRVFIYVNKAHVKMWGYDDSSEIIGTFLGGHCLDPNIPDEIIKTLKKEEECKIEFTAKRKDGSTFEVLLYAHRARDQNGHEIYPATSIDITEIKQLEAKLQQTQKMESIGNLAGGIAHDFNNILSPIMLHSEMAMDDLAPDDPLHHDMKRIYHAGERARDLVKQILTFARKRSEEKVMLNSSLIIKDVIKFLRSSIPTTIDIQYDNKAKQDVVLADPTQLNQIVMNLCTNAAFAMREKGGILEVILGNEEISGETANVLLNLKPGRYLRLSVRDTGKGISPHVINQIFDPYFTTKQPGEGTGLGLAIIHGIVQGYGGDINVESQVDQGTTFYVYIPLIDTNTSGTDEYKMESPKGIERILFVDDEKSAVDAVKKMLERLGYRVTARTNSIEALETFRNDPKIFDLVITDMTMPNMTGKKLASELKTFRPDLPIILCTGFSDQIDEKESKEMGIDAFIMKPIIRSEIAHTIREVLDN